MREDLYKIIFDTKQPQKSVRNNTHTRGKVKIETDEDGEYKDPQPIETGTVRRLGWEYNSGWSTNYKILRKILKSYVGYPYDEVYSDFCKVAKRRGYSEHLLKENWHYNFCGYTDFYVDEDGLIQLTEKPKYGKYKKPKENIYHYKDDLYFHLLNEQVPIKCGCVVFTHKTENKWRETNWVCAHGNLPKLVPRWYVVRYIKPESKYIYNKGPIFNTGNRYYKKPDGWYLLEKKTPSKKELKILHKLLREE